MALEAEIERQAAMLESGGRVQQATMAFDPATRRTRVLRLKENADDYRYFPDPDLIPLLLSDEQIERVRASLPELAEQKCARFQREHGLSAYDAQQLTGSRPLADFFEKAAAAHGNPKTVANWMLRDLRETLAALELEIEATRITPQESGRADGAWSTRARTTARSARELLPMLVREGGDPAALMRERGLEAVSDAGVLEAAVAAVIAENAENAERYRSGEEKVLNFLMGQVMRRTGGKASPAAVRELLARKLAREAVVKRLLGAALALAVLAALALGAARWLLPRLHRGRRGCARASKSAAEAGARTRAALPEPRGRAGCLPRCVVVAPAIAGATPEAPPLAEARRRFTARGAASAARAQPAGRWAGGRRRDAAPAADRPPVSSCRGPPGATGRRKPSRRPERRAPRLPWPSGSSRCATRR